MEAPRKRRTAYRSGRRELMGYESLRAALRPSGRKTNRRVGKKAKRRATLGYGLARTGLAPKRWKKG